ncbi:MAG: hypothetical protein ACP5LM_04195 [Thermoplasmata archaeon]
MNIEVLDLTLDKLKEMIAAHNNTIYTHRMPDLDNATCVYLLKHYINDLKVKFVSISEIPENERNKYVLIDMPSGIIDDEHTFISSCKRIYYIIEKSDLTVQKFRNLVDYADRADRHLLDKREKDPGSLVFVINFLRTHILDSEKIYEVYEFLANEIVFNNLSLNNMCDIEVMRKFPQYGKLILTAQISREDIYKKYVTYIPIKDKLIITNQSDHNISSDFFSTHKNGIALIYMSPTSKKAGIMFRRNTQFFNFDAILGELEKREPGHWQKFKYNISLKSGKEEIFETKFTMPELIQIVINNKLF